MRCISRAISSASALKANNQRPSRVTDYSMVVAVQHIKKLHHSFSHVLIEKAALVELWLKMELGLNSVGPRWE